MVSVSARPGMPLWIPDDLAGTCCATVWHSKGYADGAKYMANNIVEKMWELTNGGRIQVVCDAISVAFGITREIVSDLPLAKSHHSAICALAYKWIRNIFACWKANKPYDDLFTLQASLPFLRLNGSPQTLEGTDAQRWA